MTDDVTIPRETARTIAAALRGQVGSVDNETASAWADALDPRPPLRDAVARAIHVGGPCQCGADDTAVYHRDEAGAALAVIRDHIAALPLPSVAGPYRTGYGDALNAVLALFDEAEPSPTCSAHGQTVAEHGGVDCAKPSWRCNCETYPAYGLHWDTCPGRGRFDGADQ